MIFTRPRVSAHLTALPAGCLGLVVLIASGLSGFAEQTNNSGEVLSPVAKDYLNRVVSHGAANANAMLNITFFIFPFLVPNLPAPNRSNLRTTNPLSVLWGKYDRRLPDRRLGLRRGL